MVTTTKDVVEITSWVDPELWLNEHIRGRTFGKPTNNLTSRTRETVTLRITVRHRRMSAFVETYHFVDIQPGCEIVIYCPYVCQEPNKKYATGQSIVTIYAANDEQITLRHNALPKRRNPFRSIW